MSAPGANRLIPLVSCQNNDDPPPPDASARPNYAGDIRTLARVDVTLADPLVGAVLDGRYRIRGRIARGGMATVYDAVDERLERVVAVKVMHPTYAADPLFIDRFIREAKAAARLNHPNVVAVFDQGSHDELAFL